MRRCLCLLGIVVCAACVDVPDGIRAQFAAARPNEPSNYRPGPRSRVAAAPPPADKQAAAPEPVDAADAEAPAEGDGGAP